MVTTRCDHSCGIRPMCSPALISAASCDHANTGKALRSLTCQPLSPGDLRSLAFDSAPIKSLAVICLMGSCSSSGRCAAKALK
eukprot:6492250-Amphidinium_carterae.2